MNTMITQPFIFGFCEGEHQLTILGVHQCPTITCQNVLQCVVFWYCWFQVEVNASSFTKLQSSSLSARIAVPSTQHWSVCDLKWIPIISVTSTSKSLTVSHVMLFSSLIVNSINWFVIKSVDCRVGYGVKFIICVNVQVHLCVQEWLVLFWHNVC